MPRAAKACSAADCPNLQPCPIHKPKPWAGSTRRTRLPKDWEARRRQVFQRDLVCRGCYLVTPREVDHRRNNDDHSLGNLQGLCVQCHREKTQQEARRARKGRTLAVAVFSLVGLPASGKTMIRERLAEEFGVVTLTIDDADDWSDYLDQIEESEGVVIAESNIMPSRYRLLLGSVPHRIVEVTSPLQDRRERLKDRGLTDLSGYLEPHPLMPRAVDAFESDDYEAIKERFESLAAEAERDPSVPTMNQLIRGIR